jgi:hypothetical protein
MHRSLTLNGKGGRIMKKPILQGSSSLFLLLTVLLMAVFMAAGCEKPKNSNNQKTHAIMTMTDFSLDSSSCNWNVRNFIADSIYIANSQEEFLSFISCNGDPIPAIDFDQYSLILVYGWTTYGIKTITKNLQEISTSEYKLSIDITLDFTAAPASWLIAVLTPKLSQDIIITLDKVEHH